MATLKIDLNCMCLFVTNGEPNPVHVLLPATCGCDPKLNHVVRLLYTDPQGKVEKKEMEGWALTLRRGAAAPGDVPSSAEAIREKREVVNLTDLTGSRVAPEVMTGAGEGKVVSRVSIHGGVIEEVATQPDRWILGTHDGGMAHQITWRVDNVEMEWTSIGAPGKPPLESLAEVKQEDEDGEVYQLYLYHVLKQDVPKDLPPPDGEETLDEVDIQAHFPMYYPLLAAGRQVPSGFVPKLFVGDDGDDGDDDGDGDDTDGGIPPSGMHACKFAQALVDWPVEV